MTDEFDTSPEAELESLKKRAKQIGMKYHPSIGLEKLRINLNKQLAKPAEEVVQEKTEAPVPEYKLEEPEPVPTHPQTNLFVDPDKLARKRELPNQKKVRLRKKATRLVRFRLTCMNAAKKNWPGETFTVSNSFIGTIKRHIPFHANSWHCEEMLLNVLQEKKFKEHYTIKDSKGRPLQKYRLVKEFAIEVLPPLTKQEIKDLEVKQTMANNLGDD